MNRVNPKIRLLAVDLDGTLLDQEGRLSEPNSEALLAADGCGVEFIPVSARPPFGIEFALRNLGTYRLVIAYNGSYIYDRSRNQVLFDKPIHPEHVEAILWLIHQYDLYAGYYVGNEFYAEIDGEGAQIEARFLGRSPQIVPDLHPLAARGANKIIILEPHDLDMLARFFEDGRRMLPELSLLYSSERSVEISHREASKGTALRFLVDCMRLSPDQIMAIGDNYNDVSMLAYAGLGVVVANAPQEVQKAADFVVAACENDGVAEAIYRFILNPFMAEAKRDG